MNFGADFFNLYKWHYHSILGFINYILGPLSTTHWIMCLLISLISCIINACVKYFPEKLLIPTPSVSI